MFTGIVSELGTVSAVLRTADGVEITIAASETTTDLHVGDSVAVNGVCLTATSTTDGSFVAFAVGETLDRTTLGLLEPDDRVNLERPMLADGRFDGHVVQGHVDGVGTIISISDEGDARRLRVRLEDPLARYLVEKGSVTLDGTSLTVTATSPIGNGSPWIEVALIPHTLAHTVFGDREVGDAVNIEVDVIAKYVERMMELKR